MLTSSEEEQNSALSAQAELSIDRNIAAQSCAADVSNADDTNHVARLEKIMTSDPSEKDDTDDVVRFDMAMTSDPSPSPSPSSSCNASPPCAKAPLPPLCSSASSQKRSTALLFRSGRNSSFPVRNSQILRRTTTKTKIKKRHKKKRTRPFPQGAPAFYFSPTVTYSPVSASWKITQNPSLSE